MDDHLLARLPLSVLYFAVVLAMLATMEAGYRLSHLLKRSRREKPDAGLSGMVGSSLALLAFLLAFVVGFGANIDNQRRQLVVDEANAIGTAHLRAGFLEPDVRDRARTLLREYTELRLEAVDPDRRAAVVERSEQIHGELWADVEALAAARPTPVTGLYVAAVNQVIDVHAERVAAGVDNRIPASVLIAIHVVALFSTFLVGVQSGGGESRNYVAHVVLVLILGVVFFLIADIDRAHEGMLQVPQHALEDLQRQFGP